MNNAISELLLFYNEDKITGSLVPIAASFDRVTMRLIALNIVAWLKNQHKHGTQEILEFPRNSIANQDFHRLLSIWPELNELFLMLGAQFDFQDSVTGAERQLIRSFVSENYDPDLIP